MTTKPVTNGIFRIVCTLGGFAAARYFGAVAWLPLLFLIAASLALSRLSLQSAPVKLVLAGLIAQNAWFILGAYAVPSQLPTIAPDIVIDLALLILLFFKFGPGPLAATFVLQLLGMGFNLASLTGSYGNQTRALLVHILLRALIIGASAAGIYELRRSRRAAADDASGGRPWAWGAEGGPTFRKQSPLASDVD